MRSKNARRAAVAAILAGSAAIVAPLVNASPAMAVSADCNSVPGTGNYCQTAILPASSSGKIRFEAYWRQTTCRLVDRDNGMEVSSLYVPNGSVWKRRDVSGLKSDYYAYCTSPVGMPDGYISNDL
jgi:hypothetical protein